MYLRPAKLKKGKQRKKGHSSLQPKCKYGRACTRKGCIYRHDVSDDADHGGAQRQVCHAFLSASCLFGNRCRNRHPRDHECEDLRTQYAQIPCRWGKFCETEHCLYFHGDAIAAKEQTRASSQHSAPSSSTLSPALPAGAHQEHGSQPSDTQHQYAGNYGHNGFSSSQGNGGGSSFLKPAGDNASGPDERRIDPSDGGAYTQAEFLEFYGDLGQWNVAAPATASGLELHGNAQYSQQTPWHLQSSGQQQPMMEAQPGHSYFPQQQQVPSAYPGVYGGSDSSVLGPAAVGSTHNASAVSDLQAAGDEDRALAISDGASAFESKTSGTVPALPQLSFEQAAALFAAGAAVIRHHLGVEDVNFDLASKIKVGRLCEAFPVLAPSIVENAFLAFRHNFRDCAAALDVAFPGTRALDEEELERPVEVKSKDPPKVKPIPLSGHSHRRARLKEASKAVVYTGSGDQRGNSLNSSYLRLRAEAMEQAKERNRAYQRAAAAYKAGNKAAATALSRQGKAFDRKMRELHMEAAREIFDRRQQAIGDDCRQFTCDLHGLHPDEATQQLSMKLIDCYDAGQRVCYVVTGAGSHGRSGSGGGGSGSASGKLRSAVKAWLDENDFLYEETGVGGAGDVGTFVVDLSSYEY